MAANQEIKHELTCPYCMRQVDPRKVLFCIENLSATYDPAYDPQFAELQKNYLSFQAVNRRPDMPGGQVVMEERPQYLYFPWTREGCPEHLQEMYSEPIRLAETSDSLIPAQISVLVANGYTPRQLLESEETKPEQAMTEISDSSVEEEEEEEDQEEDLFTSKKRNSQQKQQTVHKSNVNTQQTVNLMKIACPHCHGVLPDDFGKLPMYRVVLLGASGCGKTTYMTSVAHLLTKGIGVPGNLIKNATLSAESERYFNYLITCQKEARIGATVRMKDAYQEPTVFPIVLTVDTHEKKFILVMNDCPGEAVEHESFIANYPALFKSDGVIFILDPLSSIHQRGAYDIGKAIAKQLEQEGIPETEQAISEYHYAKQDFQSTIAAFVRLVNNAATCPPQLRSIVMDLHKLDVIQPMLEEAGATVPCIQGNNRSDLANQHINGVNMVDFEQTSMQLTSVITEHLQVSSYSSNVQDLSNAVGKVYTIGTTTRNRNVQGQFVAPDVRSEANRGRPIADADLKGFRMLEPLLCVMAQLGLVAIDTDPVDTQNDGLYEEEPSTFWQRLFGRHN